MTNAKTEKVEEKVKRCYVRRLELEGRNRGREGWGRMVGEQMSRK